VTCVIVIVQQDLEQRGRTATEKPVAPFAEVFQADEPTSPVESYIEGWRPFTGRDPEMQALVGKVKKDKCMAIACAHVVPVSATAIIMLFGMRS
jgi:hypothetical protein